jgi:hypothetical protein
MMLSAIVSLFTSYNPVIAGVMLGVGAYIALRFRATPPPRAASRVRRFRR